MSTPIGDSLFDLKLTVTCLCNNFIWSQSTWSIPISIKGNTLKWRFRIFIWSLIDLLCRICFLCQNPRNMKITRTALIRCCFSLIRSRDLLLSVVSSIEVLCFCRRGRIISIGYQPSRQYEYLAVFLQNYRIEALMSRKRCTSVSKNSRWGILTAY